MERLNLHIRVFDNETGSFLGRAANIHTEGLMLVSATRIALDKDICLRLEHIRDNFQKIAIPLFARGVWRRETHVSGVNNTGFRFVEPSQTQIIELSNLIEVLIWDKTH